MAVKDYYTILGVLPNAEEVVIRAAYRALAQRYHPDRWQGDPTEAHERMSAINEAFHVLGDQQRRERYDRERAGVDGAELGEEREQERAFADALSELEDRWNIACDIYPELAAERARLNKIAKGLAFAFVALLVETKSFPRHAKIAKEMETQFLKRYFGSEPEILEYARSLILSGYREEARFLNRLVNVMGAETDPNRIIDQVDKKYDRPRRREGFVSDARRISRVLDYTGYYSDARDLAVHYGYEVQEIGGGFLKKFQVAVAYPSRATLTFPNAEEFVSWVKDNLVTLD